LEDTVEIDVGLTEVEDEVEKEKRSKDDTRKENMMIFLFVSIVAYRRNRIVGDRFRWICMRKNFSGLNYTSVTKV